MTKTTAVDNRGRRPVLVGVDGSVSAQAALAWAAAEASYRRCPLRIVHTFTWPMIGDPFGLNLTEPMNDGLRAAARWILSEAENQARQACPRHQGHRRAVCGRRCTDVAEPGARCRTGRRRQPGHRWLPRPAGGVGQRHSGRARPVPGDRRPPAPTTARRSPPPRPAGSWSASTGRKSRPRRSGSRSRKPHVAASESPPCMPRCRPASIRHFMSPQTSSSRSTGNCSPKRWRANACSSRASTYETKLVHSHPVQALLDEPTAPS